MNHQDRQHPIDEARWQAQEKARRGDADADPDDLRIARALRRAPPVDLPFDFASQVASLARAQAAANYLLEQRLLRGLVFVFAMSAAVDQIAPASGISSTSSSPITRSVSRIL